MPGQRGGNTCNGFGGGDLGKSPLTLTSACWRQPYRLHHNPGMDLPHPPAEPRHAQVNAFVDHPGGCYACRWFGKRVGTEVRCGYPGAGHMRSQPDLGCAFWQRERGSDD